MNKALQRILSAISNTDELDLEKSRRLGNIKTLDIFKPFYRTFDTKVYREDREIPIRLYFPYKEEEHAAREHSLPKTIFFFIHGGGFVTESLESYNRICWHLAKHVGCVLASVDYPLAPEYRFPVQIEDCYTAIKSLLFDETILTGKPEKLYLIGDSAGGNMAAALCQMARDRGEFMPDGQILIYPCTNNDYEEPCAFPSLIENGTDYLLTRQNMVDYMSYYQGSEADRTNPYFAPLLAKDFSGLPRALVITGEFDPLRDEGEAYAKKMIDAGVEVLHHRIRNGVHGFFLLDVRYPAVRETYALINEFLQREGA